MRPVFVKFSSKVQLVIPAAMRESLGIKAGTRAMLRQEGNLLILQPATEITTQQLVDDLCGMTAGGYSMADDLIAERRAEDDQAGW